MKNQKLSLEDLASRLGIKRLEDWYKVSHRTVRKNGGRSLFSKYNDSLLCTLQHAYPQHRWYPYLFLSVPANYWKDPNNIREYLEDCFPLLGLKSIQDWSHVRMKDFKSIGRRFPDYFHGSVQNMIKIAYPDHLWNPIQKKRRKRFVISSSIAFIRDMEQKLSIKEPKEWYRISLETLEKVIPRSKARSIPIVKYLQEVYPNEIWDIDKLDANKKSFHRCSQRRLYSLLVELFPSSEISENFRDHNFIGKNGRELELDIYLPKEKIAFEYQGEMHYHGIFGDISREKLDQEKRQLCSTLSITLIEIPYWWDSQIDSLKQTIRKYREDLLQT
eukprot:TRINITY_DN11397_c0_g1_i1.p1 TRINITY_DN11397_c0_g1~~TRINITY_DN11397_c0_g1_i1.p1  ORF type:complete len:331 (-),score=79.96 TRINITY_DN11397_c0_g1_i1:3-995(-)